MADITSEVIKDLLPLYVDDVVSEDTKKLVEEFLKTNGECRDYYKSLTNDNVVGLEKKNADDKVVIKSIMKKLNRKKMVGILVSSLLVAMLACGLFYRVTACESYISYEDSGLYVDNSILKTDRNYHCAYRVETQEDSKENLIEFIYLTGTVYTEYFEPSKSIEIIDFSVPEQYIEEENGAGEKEQYIKEIYYVPKEYVKKLAVRQNQADVDGFLENHLDELKDVSMLIWKEE